MQFILNPRPHMEDQRFFPARSCVAQVPYVGKIVKIWIDPTCGRYALKSLLKWHKERHTGTPVTSIEVGHQYGKVPQLEATSGKAEYALEYFLYLASNWIAYDPIVNYPDAAALLTQQSKPTTISDWQKILYSNGPIILSGVLGAASIPHAILLIGVDYAAPGAFFYLDPLSGDVVKEEPFPNMQNRIEDQIVFGKKNIGAQL
jgi:hypothetical protein